MTSQAGRIFLITGVSTGLGRAFALGALQAGHTVAGTVRRARDAKAFHALEPARARPYLLDVTHDRDVVRVVDDVESNAGPIDVLISNAAYGHEGIIEESTMRQLRDQFAVNVFGAVAVIKAVLPHMRSRRAGHIFTVTAMDGLTTFPGLGFYHGSKYALEGITETLGKEVAGLGIRVTAIEPGGFRTDWTGRSIERAERLIGDYDALFDPLRANRARGSGHELGDPGKAAQAMLRILEVPDPPAHLILGSDALRLVAAGRAAVSADFRRWKQLSRSTDFTDPA